MNEVPATTDEQIDEFLTWSAPSDNDGELYQLAHGLIVRIRQEELSAKQWRHEAMLHATNSAARGELLIQIRKSLESSDE